MPNLDPNLLLLAIAVVNAITAIIGLYSVKVTKDTQKEVRIVKNEMNGMKDALVLAKGEVAHAIGKEEGRAEGEVKAAAVLQGRNEMKLETKDGRAGPVPVSDARTAKAAESTAESTAKLADATVKIANATDKK